MFHRSVADRLMNAAVLAGRTAVITGASRGIGLGITRALARNGVSCILVGRSAQTLEAQIAELSSGSHAAFVGDVASAEAWAKFEAENVTFWCAAADTRMQKLTF